MAESPQLRASDAEREATVTRLREAAAAGRLDAAEFERRLDQAYAALTRGELDRLTEDLPAPPAPPAPRESPWRSEELRRRAAGFVTINAICIAVWLATGAQGGFWPVWVLLGTGIALFAMIVRAAFGVPHDAPRRRRLEERGRGVRRP